MVILTNRNGNEVRPLHFKKFDVDLNDTKDFELTISASKWKDDLVYGARVFIPKTEYGGIIGGKKTSTAADTVTLTGYSWRGILDCKIICPPEGEAYKIVSGDLNEILRGLIADSGLSGLFHVPEEASGMSVSGYQFDRYITLLYGMEKMLKSAGYRLHVVYAQRERGLPGYVELSAAKITDHSRTIEISQDSRLDFTLEETANGINHLICLGQGELTERTVVHLYIQEDGSIGPLQYYTGLDEIVETYEDTSADEETLIERGTERLRSLQNTQVFKAANPSLDFEVEIGDVIGGRDYITGMSMARPVANKIYTEEGGRVKVEHRLEE